MHYVSLAGLWDALEGDVIIKHHDEIVFSGDAEEVEEEDRPGSYYVSSVKSEDGKLTIRVIDSYEKEDIDNYNAISKW